MKKKKILFILQSLRAGGSASSLVNLAEELTFYGYDINIFLLEREGMYLKRCEHSVDVLPEEILISSIVCNKDKLKNKGLCSFLIRVCFSMISRILREDKVIKFVYKHSAMKLRGYDIVIAYQEELVTEYSQYINCEKKIAWCHTAFDKFVHGRSINFMKNIYSNYDEIACVSEISRDSIIQYMGINENKVDYIKKRAELDDNVPSNACSYIFVSMGRMVRVKRFDRIMNVAVKLRSDDIDFKWYIIGDGPEKVELYSMAAKCNITDYIIFLGQKENPYPWIKNATLFIMTSESEAQPMSINEALILGIPVVTTDFPSSREVINDGQNGLIVSNDWNGVYKGIKRFIEDENLQVKLSNGAKRFTYDNFKIVRQIGDLIDG